MGLDNNLWRFDGRCNLCLNDCDDCVDDWFITPDRECRIECDLDMNYMMAVNDKKYRMCEPIPQTMDLTCESCEKVSTDTGSYLR